MEQFTNVDDKWMKFDANNPDTWPCLKDKSCPEQFWVTYMSPEGGKKVDIALFDGGRFNDCEWEEPWPWGEVMAWMQLKIPPAYLAQPENN